ncbi:MAG: hypothetical protein ACRBHB_09540 [Arenicella sp.]
MKNMYFLLVLLSFANVVFSQPDISISSVYSNVLTDKTNPLWGHNSSKACITNGIRVFVGRAPDFENHHVKLYRKVSGVWQEVWVSTETGFQGPTVVCNKDDSIHVLYYDGTNKLLHYRFVDAYDQTPVKVDTSALEAYKFGYMAATADSLTGIIYIASYDNKPEGTEESFLIHSYINGVWYAPAAQTAKWKNNVGYYGARTDGSFLYPVISSHGFRVYSAAGFWKTSGQEGFHKRENWRFWDSSYYGQRRVNHFVFDGVNGVNPDYESTSTHNYFVGPNAIKQVQDGTIYILADIRSPGPEESYLIRYINDEPLKLAIPQMQTLGGMTAYGDTVVAIDRYKVHWSCDRGTSWSHQPHNASNPATFPPNTSGTLYNIGYTHVMSDVLHEQHIDAFIGMTFVDNGIYKTEVVNLSLDMGDACN